MTQGKAGFSIRRAVAIAAAAAVHAGLLLALLRPSAYRFDVARARGEPSSTLELRFVDVPPAVATQPTLARPSNRKQPRTRQPAPAAIAPHPAPASVQPSATDAPPTPPAPMAPRPGDTMQATIAPPMGDGGFQQRLQAAQHAGDVHGVPGSDIRRAPGLALVDPRTQGVAGTVRTLQRLFGVKEKACVDVDRLGTLTVEELVARHVTPTELKAMIEKNGCNEPPGLHF
jgi:hypothetical protein